MVTTLAEDFWARVAERLTSDHDVVPEDARVWVQRYRQILRKRNVGDAVYNRGEEDAVESIAAAVKAGTFPEPDHQ